MKEQTNIAKFFKDIKVGLKIHVGSFLWLIGAFLLVRGL